MKIVIDANMLVSGLLNPSGTPGRIVNLLRSGVLEMVVIETWYTRFQ
jgi:predicted nucleic acid-binding protein